ncbi:unnamed protein product, partial [Scytosiphon promiscuus]
TSAGSSSSFEENGAFGSGAADEGGAGAPVGVLGRAAGAGGATGIDAALGDVVRGSEAWGKLSGVPTDGSAGGSATISRRSSSFRNMLGSLPNGRKRGPSRASAAKRMKEDVALLLSGRSLDSRMPPKLPGHMESAVDRACAGDVDAVRSLLSMLRDHQSILSAARAENGQGLRRRATSCDPAPRTRRSIAARASVGGNGRGSPLPVTGERSAGEASDAEALLAKAKAKIEARQK